MNLQQKDEILEDTIIPTEEQEKQEINYSQSTAQIDVPDGGYGWFVVLGSFLLNMSSYGANASFSIYLAHYLQYDTFEGASKLDYASVGGISFGGGLLFAPLISIFIKQFGIKSCVALGVVFQCAGLLLGAFSKKLWQLYLTQGLLVGIGIGFIFVTAYGVLPQWFRKRRSLAVSFATSGSGIGGIVYNLSVQAIIKNINLKWAFIIQAILSTAMCIIGVFLIRTRDEFVKPVFKGWDNEIIKLLIFYLLAGFVFFSMQGYVVLLYNLADFTKTLGYSSQQAAIVSCMVSVGATVGRPLVGRFSDLFGPVTTNIFIHLVTGIFCFAMWIPIRNYASVIAFAIIQGSLMGSMWVVIGPITARIVGLKNLTTSLNMLWVVCGLSSVVAPVIGIKLRGAAPAGQLYSTDQYKNPSIYCGCTFIATALSLWCIRGYLIARDKLAEKESSHADNGELDIKISPSTIIKSLFKSSSTRKV